MNLLPCLVSSAPLQLFCYVVIGSLSKEAVVSVIFAESFANVLEISTSRLAGLKVQRHHSMIALNIDFRRNVSFIDRI